LLVSFCYELRFLEPRDQNGIANLLEDVERVQKGIADNFAGAQPNPGGKVR